MVIADTVCFAMMGIDKQRAKKRMHRISEKTLFLSAIFGGGLGGILGMLLFRHKTKHLSFKIGIPLIFVLNTVTYVLVLLFARQLLI